MTARNGSRLIIGEREFSVYPQNNNSFVLRIRRRAESGQYQISYERFDTREAAGEKMTRLKAEDARKAALDPAGQGINAARTEALEAGL